MQDGSYKDNRNAQLMTKEMIIKKFYETKERIMKVKTRMCIMLEEVKEKEKCASIKDQIIGECASKYVDKLRIF